MRLIDNEAMQCRPCGLRLIAFHLEALNIIIPQTECVTVPLRGLSQRLLRLRMGSVPEHEIHTSSRLWGVLVPLLEVVFEGDTIFAVRECAVVKSGGRAGGVLGMSVGRKRLFDHAGPVGEG